MTIRGVIETGAGQGAFFTSLEWVVEQFEEHMGFRPFPGTLNVRVLEQDIPKLEAVLMHKDFQLVPDDPTFCSADLKKVRVNGLLAALVLPSQEVRIHGQDVIEIICDRSIKESMNLADGDLISITELQEPL